MTNLRTHMCLKCGFHVRLILFYFIFKDYLTSILSHKTYKNILSFSSNALKKFRKPECIIFKDLKTLFEMNP